MRERTAENAGCGIVVVVIRKVDKRFLDSKVRNGGISNCSEETGSSKVRFELLQSVDNVTVTVKVTAEATCARAFIIIAGV